MATIASVPDAGPKTTSSTSIVGDYTYIFLNKPDTDDINWIRFTDPTKPTSGKIKGHESSEGPIASQVFQDNSIRLYYSGISEDFAPKSAIHEIRLPNAHKEGTDVTNDWVSNQSGDKDIDFETKISEATRLVDGTSFLSCSTKKVDGTLYPVITYKTTGKKGFFQYAYKHTDGSWHAQQLQLP